MTAYLYKLCHCGILKSSFPFTFIQYIPLPPLNTTVFSSTGGSFLSIMASTNSFSSQRENSQNHQANGIYIQTGPFKGQSPYIPQPLGSSGGPITHTLFTPAISHLPPPPGLPSSSQFSGFTTFHSLNC